MIHQIVAVICSLKQTKRNLEKRKMQTEGENRVAKKKEKDKE